jgi:hypothetical protein
MTNTIKVKSLLVIGPGGARMDFVAGWLGKLPGFIDVNWTIDPITGHSTSEAGLTKILDSDPALTLTEVLKNDRYELDKNAEYTLVGTCHGYHLRTQLNSIDPESYRVLAIHCPKEFFDQIAWEFFIKTYLTEFKRQFAILNDRKFNQSPEIVLAEEKPFDKKGKTFFNKDHYPLNHTKLDYSMLFVPGGSYYLIDQLGIGPIDPRYHTFWDSMLDISTSPKKIYQFGRWWIYNGTSE